MTLKKNPRSETSPITIIQIVFRPAIAPDPGTISISLTPYIKDNNYCVDVCSIMSRGINSTIFLVRSKSFSVCL